MSHIAACAEAPERLYPEIHRQRGKETFPAFSTASENLRGKTLAKAPVFCPRIRAGKLQ